MTDSTPLPTGGITAGEPYPRRWLALAVIAGGRPALAEVYPQFEGQWRSAVAGDAWDPSKPAGLAQQAPLTREYQAIFEASLKDQAAGGHGNDRHSACVLDGMPRIMSLAAPMEILIQPQLTFMVFQEAFTRRIHTDGAPMPTSEPPSFQGYSTGKWIDTDGDGRYDVLEVETRFVRGPHSYDGSGLPFHTDNQATFKERLYLDKADRNILHDEITTIDHALTRPWTVNKAYRRESNPMWHFNDCDENNHHVWIGKENYWVSADGYLMPVKKNQAPPDLRYFK